MKKIYLLDDAIISPLGFSISENLSAIRNKVSGLKFHDNKRFDSGGFYAGVIENVTLNQHFSKIGSPENFTKLEKMMLLAVHNILFKNPDLDRSKTSLIISVTKGNIDLLQENNGFPKKRVYLAELGKVIKDFFRFKSEPIIVSNACVSGGLALAIAKRFILAGKFEHAIIVGGDLVSDFVVSGFQSFQALSGYPCKPFSKNRNGISLGEAAAALLVSSEKRIGANHISLIGDASANDASHISAPSRTAVGLHKSIQNALQEAQITSKEVQYVSAHGTATIFNDEMESIAFNKSGLEDVPVNSFKGYYGHTLGASALLESILTKHSLLNNELYPSLNFDEPMVSKPLNVIENLKNTPLKYAVKTASGFGGCNLALVFKKEEND